MPDCSPSAPDQRPYGLWDSPLSPRSLAEARRLDAARYDSDGRTLVWLEGRSGQGVLVAQQSAAEAPRDLTSDLSVRAELGYGGGDFTVHDGVAYFVVHKTGRLYRQALGGGQARAITPAFGQAASPVASPDGHWVVYVHTAEDVDRLAIVDAEGHRWPQILAEGHDFFMQPRFSPDGKRLAWIAWDHPRMPWDGTTLYQAAVLTEGGGLPRLGTAQPVAGGDEVAIFQPEFAPDGRTLLYISDETGWGRIVVHDLASGERRFLSPDGVECGAPAWVQDQRTYAVCAEGGRVVAAASERGFARLMAFRLSDGAAEPVAAAAEYSEVLQVAGSPRGQRVAFIGSAAAISPRVVEVDLATGASRVVARSAGETVPAEDLAPCEALAWTTAGGEPAHGLYYPPHNPRFAGRGRPPLVVLVHGGPTSQYRAGWRPDAQFFATRGYAVLAVNYRGSTGYGRPYMLKLRGNWGVCDVEDSVSGALFLAESGRANRERMAIMGGSAGGFTVLHTLATRPEVFAAGISLYGVADQFHLAAETHKFESRYLDSMLGPLPEAAAVYRERSPVLHAERIRRPLAVYQGDIDRVVPKAQSDAIVEALKRTGTPHVYHVYEGEGHGWRKRESIEHFYRTVDEFLRREVLMR
jgi:dipeptidyl aminopeptidase/acylaminoacyl peptidase